MRYTIDTHGNVAKTEQISADGTTSTRVTQWTYNEAENAAACIKADGTTEQYWYDEQGRVIRSIYPWVDDAHHESTAEYTDVTR